MIPIPKPEDTEEIQGPAIVRPFHVQSRQLSPVAGSPKGWKRQSPLEAAYDRGQLGNGNPKYTAEARYQAGIYYGYLVDIARERGRDSTDVDKVNKSASGSSVSDQRIDAIKALVSIDSHLASNDRKILRLVCGEWVSAAEAIRSTVAGMEDAVWARMRESLDALVEAAETARRSEFKFRMER